jgi:hypothetical protein|nr:MAG TPA: hypothetical protein [Caudovirales sp. ctNII2]
MKFGDYEPNESWREGEGEYNRFYFQNGYGASVIRSPYSGGYKQGRWELMVLKKKGPITRKECYGTPITNDVMPYLDEKDVVNILKKIERLPERTKKKTLHRKRGHRRLTLSAHSLKCLEYGLLPWLSQWRCLRRRTRFMKF